MPVRKLVRGNAVVTDCAELANTSQHEPDDRIALSLLERYESTRDNLSWTFSERFLNRASQVRSLPGALKRSLRSPCPPRVLDA